MPGISRPDGSAILASTLTESAESVRRLDVLLFCQTESAVGWRLHGDGTPRAGLWSDASNLQRHTGLMNKRGVHLIAFGPSDTTWSVDGTALADLT